MRKSTKVIAAVAAGPSGLRRFLGLVLVVVLIAGLGFAALMALGVWSASQSGDDDSSLPCPPDEVAVAFTPKDAPAEVQQAVEAALADAGREVTKGGWGEGQERDLVVVWTPGSDDRLSGSTSPSKLTLGSVPTAAEVTDLLGDRLAACESSSPTPTPAEAEEPAEQPQESAPGFEWPWAGGVTPAAGIGLAAGLWWLVGPNAVRAAGRGLWPLRLGWRRMQRSNYRRRLARGWEPAEWPGRISPGQRWHEDDKALHDHRGYRQQVSETEPERRTALREAIREERLAGTGIGPARLWRRVYRTPVTEDTPAEEQGTPEMEEVSS